MDLELTVNGVQGTVRLWSDDAPETVAALVGSLPVTVSLKQCRWSGDACFAPLDHPAITRLGKLEIPAVTIYPGTLAVRLAEAESPHAELLVGYGCAEHRWPDGPKPITPVGEITEGRSALFELLRAIALTGPASMMLRSDAGGA